MGHARRDQLHAGSVTGPTDGRGAGAGLALAALAGLAAAALLLPGCGGKLNEKKTTPSSSATVTTESIGGASGEGAGEGAASSPGGGPSGPGGPGSAGSEGAASGPGGPGSASSAGQRDDASERARDDKASGRGSSGRSARRSDQGERDRDERDRGDRDRRERGARSADGSSKTSPTASARGRDQGADLGADQSADKPDAKKTAERAAKKPPKKPPKQPKIAPPDLDLPASDQRRRVEARLTVGEKALTGPNKSPDRALSAARDALAADATSIDAVVLMAHAYHVKGHRDTAEVMLDMLYRERVRARDNVGVYYVYGLIYDHTERPERAMNAYVQAVRLDPNHKGALINLGVHYLRKKMFDEAALVYEKLVGELSVKSATVWTNLGSAYRGRAAASPAGDPARDELLKRAETAYKRAMTADRGYANVYYNLGLLYLDAAPFPGRSGALDELKRLGQARTYFDEYRQQRGADTELVDERIKQVDKLIKREKKRRKRASSGESW
ncbi:MAG: hypothetical protein Tsb0020_20710 [Haliangiales bacterium]